MEAIITLKRVSISLVCLILSSQAGCNLPYEAGLLTPVSEVTQADRTVEARLTQEAASPISTARPRPGSPNTPSPAPDLVTESPAPATRPASPSPTAICDRAAAGNPIDLTIPDDTQMRPGEAFIKKWALRNIGNCRWTEEYAVRIFSGEQMGAPDITHLSQPVEPGETVEIDIDMIAPMNPGTYQGNWKLQNPSGDLFGIGPNGSSPFWVRIEVVQPPTTTPTPPTETATPTPTRTPAIQAIGSATLLPGSRLDLDSMQVVSGGGEDLSYESDAAGSHFLIPQGGATIGAAGVNRPGIEQCQSARLGSAPIDVKNLTGTYLCYRTSQGLPGWLLVKGQDTGNFALALDVLTWFIP